MKIYRHFDVNWILKYKVQVRKGTKEKTLMKKPLYFSKACFESVKRLKLSVVAMKNVVGRKLQIH